MTEINLLPEELRKNEEKETEAAKKKSKFFAMEMAIPQAEEKPKAIKLAKPSLLSRLFSTQKSLAKSRPDPEMAVAKPVEESFHRPQGGESSGSLKVDFTKDLESAIKSEPKDEAEELKVQKLVTGDNQPGEKKKKSQGNFGRSLFPLFFRRAKPDRAKLISAKPEVKAQEKETERAQRVLNVDLIPAELSKYPELELPKKLFSSGLVLLAVVLLVGAAYLGITWYQLKVNNQLKNLETETAQLKDQISVYESQKEAALLLQNKLEVVRNLLDDHIYWTKFFSRLEKYTINEVYYTNFSMAGTDKLVLSAVGKDYESVAKQLVAFQQAKDFITEVEINAAAAELDEEGEYAHVTFNINLVLSPEVFKEPIK